MSQLIAEFGAFAMAGAFMVLLFGGFVKGAVGFALPMITISGVGSLMSAEAAIAAIILPSLTTNIRQSFRNGPAEAIGSIRKYWRLNITLLALIGVFAQLVVWLPEAFLFIVIGCMVTIAGVIQLSGWRPQFPPHRVPQAEVGTGLVSAFFGGLAGVWGPPILLYLLARDTPKAEMVRVQGIAFLFGSIVLLVAHLQSGVLNSSTLSFSALLAIPAIAGMALGQMAQDWLDQERFRVVTLVVLVIAGLNLLRRGIIG